MDKQLDRIKLKLGQLKEFDKKLTLFGSEKHKYNFGIPLTSEVIREFETRHNIKLPIEFVDFYTTFGNGGAGPFYGLEPLENVLFDDLDYKRKDNLLNPSKPFPHTKPWNVEFTSTVSEDDDEEEYERQYFEFSKDLMNGALAICNYGCGISLNLVVNGEEFGHIWTDDRGNDGGIYPSTELGNKDKINFLDWYELWLDNSLVEIANKIKATPIMPQPIQTEQKIETKFENKPWWKFWA
ncbi:MAG: SMI1/KNR4 family protein [Pedobacter sp.]|nr:MAG: SMI1/KNR4 family protein [Pedobacter sp.]